MAPHDERCAPSVSQHGRTARQSQSTSVSCTLGQTAAGPHNAFTMEKVRLHAHGSKMIHQHTLPPS